MRTSESRTENVARELLTIRGWKVAKPPRGHVLWKNEYRDYPHLLDALKGKGKQGRGGDGYPDFLVVHPDTIQPLIVGETKPADSQIAQARFEAQTYSDAFVSSGLPVLAAGIAGDDDGDIRVSVDKWSTSGWREISYREHPIQWIPTPQETALLLRDATVFELYPKVPSNEVLALRGEEINRILRESKIADAQRPQITGAIMLALVFSKGDIRTDPEHVLSDINQECRKAFLKAGKAELVGSLQVPEGNGHLAARAGQIVRILRLLNITTLTSEADYLGQLYETFFRFTGGNTIGQYFTPRHITNFSADLTKIGGNDFVIDPTCGTGGFLIAALTRMIQDGRLTSAQLGSYVKDHLIGYESEPTTAALCVANMILRGDGKTGIIPRDCFTDPNYPVNRATVALGNPPFPHTGTDTPPERFIDRALESLVTRGQLVMVVPSSLLVKEQKKAWRAKILRNNGLKAVIALPTELFQPYASSTTALLVLEKGVPQTAADLTFFCRIENDGFKLRKNVRVEHPGSELPAAMEALRTGKSIPGFCTHASLGDAIDGSEWSPGAFIEVEEHAPDRLREGASFLIRNLTAFHALYAPQLADFQEALRTGLVEPPVPYVRKAGTRQKKNTSAAGSVGGLFDIYYGQSELESKQGLQPGLMPVISSAGTDNGCYGFFDLADVAPLLQPPFVTVPRTGSIGEAFVQLWPCGVTSDCLVLVPREGTDLADLFLAASAIRLEKWRYDYGRKITPSRIADVLVCGDPGVKEWVRDRLAAARPLMSDATRTLSSDGLDALREKFKRLAAEWRDETGHLSSLNRKLMHPAYQRILAMGQVAIPFILAEMTDRGGHWFAALQFLTGENPAAAELTQDEAKRAWKAWGLSMGYVHDAK